MKTSTLESVYIWLGNDNSQAVNVLLARQLTTNKLHISNLDYNIHALIMMQCGFIP